MIDRDLVAARDADDRDAWIASHEAACERDPLHDLPLWMCEARGSAAEVWATVERMRVRESRRLRGMS